MSLRRQDSHTPQPQFEDGSVYGEKRPTVVDSNQIQRGSGNPLTGDSRRDG